MRTLPMRPGQKTTARAKVAALPAFSGRSVDVDRDRSRRGGSREEVVVLIDDRAGSKQLVAHPPLNSVGVLTRLDSGDALITGNGPNGQVLVGVEVKSTTDLISSADTGRLQAQQVPAMLKEYDSSWLLHYGSYRPGKRGELEVYRGKGRGWQPYSVGSRFVPYGYVEGLLLTLTAVGVHCKHVFNIEECAEWIYALAWWWNKPWDKHKGMKVLNMAHEGAARLMPQLDSEAELRARIAAQLPGVGYGRAVEAAKHFGGVREMLTAGEEEWREVPGIGKVVARKIVETLK